MLKINNNFTFQNFGIEPTIGIHTPEPNSFNLQNSTENLEIEQHYIHSAKLNAEVIHDYNILGTRVKGRYGTKVSYYFECTEIIKARGYWPKSQMYLIGLNFRSLFPVCGFLASNLKLLF